MTARSEPVRAAAMVLALMLWAVPVCAQTGQTAQIPLQFDFLNPGARSLGLGGAFTAVADDATAAFTNPAGLTLIVRPEVSAELRFRDLNTPFLSGGRLSGTPSGNGVDTVSGPQYGVSTDSALRPYFVSFVYPKGRWSVAGFRHELVFQNNTFISQGPFQQVTVDGDVINNFRNFGLQGARDLTVDNYGGAIGFRASPKLSLGVEVSAYHFSDTSNFAALGFVGGLFGTADPTTAGQSSTTTQTGSATSFALNAGALVTVTPKVRAGFVFRQGVAFPFSQTSVVPGLATLSETGQFRTPYVIAGGVRVQATEVLVVAVDYDRVAYSRLTKDFIADQVDPAFAGRLSVQDGNEVHVGVEYTFVGIAHTPSLRAGLWFDPDHTVQYASDGSNSAQDELLKATFPGGAGVWHYCVGYGMPVSRSFEFNAGADLASARKYVSASIVARFGK